jgi:hypothetical protein
MPAAIVQPCPDVTPFRNSVTRNESPTGTFDPKTRPADVIVPAAATVATLHVVADVFAHELDNDTYSGVEADSTAEVVAVALNTAVPAVRVTCSSNLSPAATARAMVIVQLFAPAATVQLDPEVAPFWNNVTRNESPAGTFDPKTRPADVIVPAPATVATLHAVADVFTHELDNDTYSGAAADSVAEVVAVAMNGAVPAVRVT